MYKLKQKVVVISWSLILLVSAGGSSFSLYKVLIHWNDEKLGHWKISQWNPSSTENLHFSRNASSGHVTEIPHPQNRKKRCRQLLRLDWNRKTQDKTAVGMDSFFHKTTAYMAWIPRGSRANLIPFYRTSLTDRVWKGEDWKCSAGVLKDSPKPQICTAHIDSSTYLRRLIQNSSKFDEKNKFCTFVKVFPPTLSDFQKNSGSIVVLMLSSLK